MIAGCASDYDGNNVDELVEYGTAEQGLAQCAGDDPTYDYNAYSASLAVAIANELGRWDVNADFEVRSGKLELSTTGGLRCGTGCGNIKAILRLQDDASSVVANHSPSIFRTKLTSWHQKQATKLTGLVDTMLKVDKGIYRVKAKHSGKYMAVDASSTSDGALIEQQSSATGGADQWQLKTEGTYHKLVNVRSGKCLSLSSDSASNGVTLVQKTCAASTPQQFRFSDVGSNVYAIRTKYSLALDVSGASQSNDARVVQQLWNGPSTNQQWTFEPVGSGAHLSPELIPTAVYSLSFVHSGKALGVDSGSLSDGAAIEQYTYASNDDRYHWYVTPAGDKSQFINRRSGKCLALASESSTAALVQKTCANVGTQLFTLNSTGDHQILYSHYGNPLEIAGSSTSNDVRVTQAATGAGWSTNRQITFTPVIAGEPHRLKFSHKSTEADCGDYYWYDIAQPNGQPLKAPADSFVQLIFAGGKETLTGNDVNPFIAQQVSGNQVAIDPTYGLNEGVATSTGSCTYANIVYDPTKVANGKCCVKSSGVSSTFYASAWSPTTFVCR